MVYSLSYAVWSCAFKRLYLSQASLKQEIQHRLSSLQFVLRRVVLCIQETFSITSISKTRDPTSTLWSTVCLTPCGVHSRDFIYASLKQEIQHRLSSLQFVLRRVVLCIQETFSITSISKTRDPTSTLWSTVCLTPCGPVHSRDFIYHKHL